MDARQMSYEVERRISREDRIGLKKGFALEVHTI